MGIGNAPPKIKTPVAGLLHELEMLKFKCFGIDLFAVCPRRRHKCSHDTNPSPPSPFLLQPKIRRERGETRGTQFTQFAMPVIEEGLFWTSGSTFSPLSPCPPVRHYWHMPHVILICNTIQREKESFKLLKSKCKCKNAWQMAIE